MGESEGVGGRGRGGGDISGGGVTFRMRLCDILGLCICALWGPKAGKDYGNVKNV